MNLYPLILIVNNYGKCYTNHLLRSQSEKYDKFHQESLWQIFNQLATSYNIQQNSAAILYNLHSKIIANWVTCYTI